MITTYKNKAIENPLITISSFGSIRVLNIPLCCNIEYAKKELSEYNVEENDNCLYISNRKVRPDLPILTIIYSKSKVGNLIDKISLHSQSTKEHCDIFFDKLKSIFDEKFVFTQKISDTLLELQCSSYLCEAKIFRQYGDNYNSNRCHVGLNIATKSFGSDAILNQNIRKLFLDNSIQPEIEMKSKSIFKHLIVLIITLVVSVFLYLIAMNGRYSKATDGVFFDKWTCKYIEF